jgi:hypothetical protein
MPPLLIFENREPLVWSLAALLLLVAIVALWPRREWRVAAKPLLTANELEFYARLRQALPDQVVLCQVAMGAFLQPEARTPQQHYLRVRSRFAQKISDFVVCDPTDMRIRVVIELDDRTHDDRRDAARDAMLAQAGIDTLRFSSRQKPGIAAIRSAVAGYLNT